jgi:hypothetical protein
MAQHMKVVDFAGLECAELQNDVLTLLVTRSVGPRVIALWLKDGENLFAELPDTTLHSTKWGRFHVYGGHRLWHAPEVPSRTYLPDDKPVRITPVKNGLRVIQETEPTTGIEKSMIINLPNRAPKVIIQHILTNRGVWPVECAPWAITQLRCGGTAILPQVTTCIDMDGVQPNRSLTLWPYTDIQSPELYFGNRYIMVKSCPGSTPIKLGYPNRRGWLAYQLGNELFVKYAPYEADGDYFDMGASSQCYCNPEFLELETLGPRVTIAPGASVSHVEVWQVFRNIPDSLCEETVCDLVNALKLDQFVIKS